MFKNKIGLILILATLGISTLVFVFANKNEEDEITKSPEVSNEKKSENKSPENLEDLSIKELTKIRDNEIDKNLEELKELQYTKDEIKEYKNHILDPDCVSGLVGFMNREYKDLTKKDKLKKEVEIVRYINSINDRMDPSGAYFDAMNEDYQINNYFLKHGTSWESMSYENIKFVIQNIDDICKYIDYDSYYVVLDFNPYYLEGLSKDEKKSLNEEWKKVYSKENLDPKLKNQIKSVIK